MTELIDLYCERTAPGAWNEPLNLLSNLAFAIAGAMAWRLWRRRPDLGWRNGADLLVLVGLLFAIGAGSAWWHAAPTRHSLLADVLPILLFIHLYLLVFLRRVARLHWCVTLTVFALFVAANVATRRVFPPDLLNGSIFYAPAWLALVALTILLAARRHPEARRFEAAAALFTVSLLLRTTDAAACEALPVGTHFLWHLLNGAVLYLFAAVAIRSARR